MLALLGSNCVKDAKDVLSLNVRNTLTSWWPGPVLWIEDNTKNQIHRAARRDQLGTGCQMAGLAPVLSSENMLLSSKETHTLFCHQKCCWSYSLQLFSLNRLAIWHNFSSNFPSWQGRRETQIGPLYTYSSFHPFLKEDCHISISISNCCLAPNCKICAQWHF